MKLFDLIRNILKSIKPLSRIIVKLAQNPIYSELEENQIRLKEAQEIARMGSWHFDVTSKKIHWSEEMYKAFPSRRGLGEPSIEELLQLIHPDDAVAWESAVSKCLKDGKPYTVEFRVIQPDGRTVWLRGHGQATKNKDDQIVSLNGACQDISEAKFREQVFSSIAEIRKYYQDYQNNQKKLFEFIIKKFLEITESEFGVVAEVRKKVGVKPAVQLISIVNQNLDEKTVDVYRPNYLLGGELLSFDTVFDWIIENRKPILTDNFEADERIGRILDQPPKILKFMGLPIFKGGEIVGVIGIANSKNDYTESLIEILTPLVETIGDLLSAAKVERVQNSVQRELYKQSQFLKNTVDRLPAVFYAKDSAGRYLLVNEAFRKLLAWDDAKIIGKNDHQLFPRKIADIFRKNDLEIIAKRRVIESEEIAIDADGKERAYHSFKFPYIDEKGSVYATGGVSLDITDKKAFERQAFHRSKLAAIGELAAGVGHEINNPLGIIVGNFAMLRKRLNLLNLDQSEVDNCLSRIEESTDRIANIVNGLRTFARADDLSEKIFDVANVLRQSIALVRDIYQKDGINLDCVIPNQQVVMRGNPGRIQQAFMNIISNAKDATEGQEKRSIYIEMKVHNRFVAVNFTDNGRGVPEHLREKIFDSFFTTKEIGHGTGIGLSLTSSIVKEHNGVLSYESSMGEGTTFNLRFPLEKQAKVADEPNEKIKFMTKDRLHVLVVDDEEGIRGVLRFFLEGLGCEVDEAHNGRIALSKVKEGAFDFIFTDMKMPEMDGPTLIHEIRKMSLKFRPNLIGITGGVTMDFSKGGQDEISKLIDGYLLKPFDQAKVAEILKIPTSRYG